MHIDFKVSDPAPSSMPEIDGRQVAFLATVMVLTSGMLVWAGWTRHSGLKVPPFIAYVTALIFFTGAVMLLLKSLGSRRRLDPLAAIVMSGFTVTSGWVAVYGDPRSCHASGPLWLPLPSCRTAFGASAVLTGFVTWMILVVWIRRMRRRPGAHPASMVGR